MSDENLCPQCGAALPAQSPQGLCPGCLLKWGLESQTGGEETGSQPAAADRPPPTPEEIAAYFPELEILELVGRGGMGVVYKARQKRLDRLVALKILAPRIGQDPAFSERFAREARAMAMLSHPHVVAVHDFGQTDGLYYFLMEFVDGVNLRRLLDTGKLAPEEALAIVPQICEALQYAHDHGVVHRDIKPENVLLDKEGRVKIADFGIAKLVGKEAKDLTLTGAGQIIGTPQYMAPEQIEHPLQVDHRADIYSLGVVFYQMLTGELPIGRFAPPSKKVQIDVRLDEVVLRALEKEPERRYQQASEIKTHIETLSSPMTSGAGERLSADRSAGTYESGSSAAPTNWLAWLAQATFRSPEVVAIYNHMTVAERREQATRQGVVGVVLFALFVAPGFVFLASTIAGVFVFVAAVAALSILVGQWRKLLKQHLCSTAWSREQGLTPDRLRLTILDPPLRTGQPHARKQAGPSAPARAGADVAIDEVQRNVRGPAIGVLVIGILNWLIAVPLCLTFLWWGGSYSPHPLASGRKVASELDPASVFWTSSSTLMMICLLAILVISSLMIFAALKMKRLQAYWLAVAASILAIIISPGNLIGLPIGIWSLVVLGQREVRTAFARHRARPAGKPEAGDSEGVFGAPQVAVPRLSKTALAGAVWAGPFFLIIVVSLCAVTLWTTLSLDLLFSLLSPILTLLLATPIGVTILGYVALKQIRRSAGLLYGLELALFDLLAFPLLALDAVIAGLGIVAVRASTGGLGGAVAFFLIVVACVAVDVLVVRWGWRTVNQPPAGTLPAERSKRGGLKTRLSVAAPVMMFCLGVFGFAFLLWSVTERIENSRARIHTRIFEADANLVDELVPRPRRQSAHARDNALEISSRDPQTAEISADIFAKLLADGANPPGLLEEQVREGDWWPKLATSAHYFRRGKIAGDGYVDGFLGVRRHKDARQLRVEYNILHGMNSAYLGATVVWEGSAPPPDAVRAFFIPFSRRDGTARYLVIALEVGESEQPSTGEASGTSAADIGFVDLATHPSGPWIAKVPSGIVVELAGVGQQDNKTWWSPSGSSLAEPPCELLGKSRPGDKSQMVRVFFASVRNRPSEPIGMKYDVVPSSATTSFGTVKQHGREVPNFVDFMVFDAAVPASARTTTVRCGISAGSWTEQLATWTPSGSSRSFKGSLTKPVETKEGVLTVASDNLTDELRVVAVTNEGRQLVARLERDEDQTVSEKSPGEAAKTLRRRVTRAIFPDTTINHIKQITLEARPYHWVEFRNVALQPLSAEAKEGVSGRRPATPTTSHVGGEPTAQPQVPWGDWNASWSVRLRAKKTVWSLGTLPEFVIDLRTREKCEPDVVQQSLHNWLLDVDGQRFRLGRFSTSWEHRQVFEPGTTRDGFIAFRLHQSDNRVDVRTVKDGAVANFYALSPVGKDGQVLSHPEPQDQLRLPPGKHVVRIAFPVMHNRPAAYAEWDLAHFALSNPVDI